ncbi:hypothetical protein ACFYXC_12640 [Streptomyces sp. NPDC002701]|uniref:hypothetical protein n=1 Tax=Streptomyces sp. NPDC002701 TaxID=3364661 RepID=UPI003685DB21
MLRGRLDAEHLQQVLRGHQPIPPRPLRGDPGSEVLALHDQLARRGREGAARLHVGEGEPVAALPADFPGHRTPPRINLSQSLLAGF